MWRIYSSILLLLIFASSTELLANADFCQSLFDSDPMAVISERVKAFGMHLIVAKTSDSAEIKQFIDFTRTEFGIRDEPLTSTGALDADLVDITLSYTKNRGELLILRNGDNALMGVGGLYRLDHDTSELRKLYLDPSTRGNRVGKAMTLYFISLARQLGYKRLELETYENMTSAKNLYMSLGFKRFDSPRIAGEPGVEAYVLDLGKN